MGDSVTTKWYPFMKNFSAGESVLFLTDALTHGDWRGVSSQINLEWEARKMLAPGVTTPMIETLIASAFAAGARAAKVCGAGGGGCLFCVADPDDVPAIELALTSGGARLLPYRIETDGLRIHSA